VDPVGQQAFDVAKFEALGDVSTIPAGALCTLGFDGARFRDSTGFVLTEVVTGVQMQVGLWERPEYAPEDWEVPEDEVHAKFEEVMETYDVWQAYATRRTGPRPSASGPGSTPTA
jgi:hypothetical protein